MFGTRSRGIVRIGRGLATADALAHASFALMFAWRVVTGGFFGSAAYVVLAVVSVIGLVAGFVGGALLKHGGRLGAQRIGLWAVGGSTFLAALLLLVASSLG